MTVEFKLPQVSEGVETAEVAEVLVAEGDVIEAGQVVLEVETEKAVAEIECPHAGRVVKVHVQEGQEVRVGQVLLTIEESVAGGKERPSGRGEPASEAAEEAEPAERPASEAAAAGAAGVAESAEQLTEGTGGRAESTSVAAASERDGTVSEAERRAGISSTTSADVTETPAKKAEPEPSTRPPAPAGPATRRLARQLGVDLYAVQGTGPGGRITEEDVKAFVRERMAGTAGAVGAASSAAPPLPDFRQFGPVEREPLSKLARTAAANLALSWQLVPHVTQHDQADVTELEAARRRFVQSAGPDSPKVTLTAVLIKAVVGALKAFPKFNASLDVAKGELILKRYYHIGCAVDTPHGLVVPVIRDADQKSVVQIAAELADLAARARERKLRLEEMQGGSFTVTNLGGIGGTAFTPIVNYPEVAILGVARTRRELHLNDDGELQERLVLPLSLSYDHRVINGADGARFLAKLCQDLSDPFRLLAEL